MTDKEQINNEKLQAQALKLYRKLGVGCNMNCIAYDFCEHHKVHYKRCVKTISQRLASLIEQSKYVEKEVKKCLKNL